MSYSEEARAQGIPLQPADVGMLEKIDRVGWMVQIVAADADNPTFAYTIGAV